MYEGITNTQQCDIYQLSLVIFELLFSTIRNSLKFGDEEYKVILKNFTNEEMSNFQRIPTNFIIGSLPEEWDTVCFNCTLS